jgi:hypothetical protein
MSDDLATLETRSEADYFERNVQRMRYPRFRRQHLLSARVYSKPAARWVLGSRLKQSGTFWTIRRAKAILAPRCSNLNGRFEDYWKPRLGRPNLYFYVARLFSTSFAPTRSTFSPANPIVFAICAPTL